MRYLVAIVWCFEAKSDPALHKTLFQHGSEGVMTSEGQLTREVQMTMNDMGYTGHI